VKHYLLDTQVALWLLLGSDKLPEKPFRERFLHEPARLIFHQVSTWEIQIKYELGKLPLPRRPEEFLLDAIGSAGFIYEKIDDQGIFLLDRLPKLHRDPFDRLLISHALLNGWCLITSDQEIQKYPVVTAKV
jgi:PIN domain nuclease of toxin-antitoxin system